MSLGGAIVVVLNVASIGLIFAFSFKAYRNSRADLIPPKIPKARILSLRVDRSELPDGRYLQENYWTFEEPYVEHAQSKTGERMLCGYTDRELCEIARRRKEWGI